MNRQQSDIADRGSWIVDRGPLHVHHPPSTIHHPHGGSILIYVLWVTFLLSLFAVSVASQASAGLRFSDRMLGQLRMRGIAQAGLLKAIEALALDASMVDTLSDPWADSFHDRTQWDGIFSLMSSPKPDPERRYGLADEERRLNLNTAPKDALDRLIRSVTPLAPDDADALADAISDWRDEDDDAEPHGAEHFYYRGLANAYDCKNGPFEQLEELRLVKGVSPAIYRWLEPHVTVYGSGAVNVNTTSPVIFAALGLSPQGVAGLRAFRSGEDGLEGTGDDQAFSSVDGMEADLRAYLPQADLGRLAQLMQKKLLTVSSRAFRFHLEASDGTPAHAVHAMGIIDREGHVKLWTER
ncbi:MAG: general secretion pathway protein GspK [Candidatus Omnitrophica bacterium]|nr:general secretion pathway protein GspK [Candidatus Omnitrophota bacterium]